MIGGLNSSNVLNAQQDINLPKIKLNVFLVSVLRYQIARSAPICICVINAESVILLKPMNVFA